MSDSTGVNAHQTNVQPVIDRTNEETDKINNQTASMDMTTEQEQLNATVMATQKLGLAETTFMNTFTALMSALQKAADKISLPR